MANENDQEIKITFDTNAKEATKDSNTLGKSLDTVEKKTGTLSKSNAELSKTQKDAKKSSDDQKAGFEDLGSGIGDTIGQVKGLGKQFLALLANPIILFLTALVAVLTLVAKAFTNSFEGGEKVKQVMAGITATGQALLDNLGKIGSAIVKALTLDFSGAKREMEEVVGAARDAFNKMSALKKEAQQLEYDQADNDLDAIKRRATLADLKDKLLDDSVSYKDKKRIQSELLKASEENAKSDIELAKKIATNKIAALTLEKDGAKKNYVEIKKIQAEQLQGEIDNSNELKQIRKQGASLDREERARNKQIADERKAQNKIRLDQIKQIAKEEEDARKKIAADKLAIEMKSAVDAIAIVDALKKNVETPIEKEKREFEEKKIILQENNLSVEELTRQHLEKVSQINKEQYDKETEAKNIQAEKDLADQKKIDDAMLQQEKDVQNSRVNLAESFVNFLKQIAGKNKALQKAAIIVESALGIGKSLIANTTANAGALATPQAILTSGASAVPVIAFNNVSTGLGIASNIAATAKALQAVGGGSAPSAGGGMSGSGSSMPPSVAFNNTAENQIGQSVARTQGDLPALKVYVSESDISKAQNNVKVLVNKNTF